MKMETRCFHEKLEFQRYSPKDFCTAAKGNTGEKMFVFLGLFVHAAVRGETCAFTLKIGNTLIKNSSSDDRPSIST